MLVKDGEQLRRFVREKMWQWMAGQLRVWDPEAWGDSPGMGGGTGGRTHRCTTRCLQAAGREPVEPPTSSRIFLGHIRPDQAGE